MAFDTFVGLPLDQSIAGAAWDSGGMTWSAGTATKLVGNGADAVKSTQVTPNQGFANYASLDGQIGQAVFFKIAPGRLATNLAISLYIDGAGAYDQYAPTAAARASVGASGMLAVRDMAGAAEATVACPISDDTEYCLELVKTTNVSGKEYRANMYAASGGVRGGLIATQAISLVTALPGTNKRVQLATTAANHVLLTIVRAESVDAAAATPVSFTGPVPTRNGAVGSAASFANAGFFAGSATPFAYTLQAGVLPAGLTLDSATGIVSGTPTTAGTASGIVVRATDANSATADTNAYSIVIASSNAAPTFPGTIANISGTGGTAITPVNVSGQFSDSDALAYSASPAGTAWPSGLVVNASTGIISGTVATSTTAGLKVRATDTASQTVDSNAFSVTLAASAPSTGSFTTDEMESSGTLRISQACNWTWFAGGVIGTTTGTATHGSGTTTAGAQVVATGLPLGAGYIMVKFADGGVAYQTGTVA